MVAVYVGFISDARTCLILRTRDMHSVTLCLVCNYVRWQFRSPVNSCHGRSIDELQSFRINLNAGLRLDTQKRSFVTLRAIVAAEGSLDYAPICRTTYEE